MKIFIVSLFGETLESALKTSILGRSVENGSLTPVFVRLSEFSIRPTRRVDDRVYGGGRGTLLQCEPISLAIESIYKQCLVPPPIWVMAPGGDIWHHALAKESAERGGDLIIVCGHYEGIDERVIEYYQMRKISIGQFVLTGGETAALVIIDSIARLLPGVIQEASHEMESFAPGCDGKIEHPHYTRPDTWKGISVPEVLLSGDHHRIEQWRNDHLKEVVK